MKTFTRWLCLLMVVSVLAAPAAAQEEHPLAGQSIEMAILGIGGWLPSSLGAEMAQELFAPYAAENFGYEVSFSFADAPFSQLFQRAAASLSTRSNEFNIIISDSQWLGAFAEPGWIVNMNDIIAENPELDIDWYNPIVVSTYMTYPDGTDQLWGLPQEGDVMVLFVRQDLFTDPAEREAFAASHDFELPQTFEDWEDVTMTQYEQIAAFFTRPDEGLYGSAKQYDREYDYASMNLYPFMFSLGGDIWDPATGQIEGILDSDINAEAMVWNKRMLDYMPPGATNYGIGEVVDIFAQGQVATAFQWAAVGLSMITEETADDVLVVAPPLFERADGSLDRTYSMGGQPWVINAYNTPEQMRVATDFLKWWYLPETQLEFARRGGNPTDAQTLNAEGFDDINPWNRAYRYMLQDDRARDFWHEPNYSEMLSVQQEGFTAFTSGQVDDPANVLRWIACQQQQILFEAERTEIEPSSECRRVRLR